MKITKSLTVFIALIALSFTVSFAQQKIEVLDGLTHDWGKVAPQQLKTEIKIKNTGDKPLNIKEVRPGCGCTASKLDTNFLNPGEVATVSISLDAHNKAGDITKIVTITTDDPVNPSLVYTLKAFIKTSMTITPAEYFLANAPKISVESETKVQITNSGEENLTIETPEFISGNMKARFDLKKPVTLKPGEGMELKAYITPTVGGSMNGSVRVKTSSKERPEINFPVYGNVEDPTPPSTPATQVTNGNSVKEIPVLNPDLSTPTNNGAGTGSEKVKGKVSKTSNKKIKSSSNK
ncbi:MAG: DUF1573 domain-containing protein [Chlorobiota bacterium]|jgi:hypothetical protein|nr:DUF1573 domain-containing protein [Chlorobiota bacterium]QQS66371.1 MAG: DUF1573 domain-containing protein [Chlorobiota bacterium]